VWITNVNILSFAISPEVAMTYKKLTFEAS